MVKLEAEDWCNPVGLQTVSQKRLPDHYGYAPGGSQCHGLFQVRIAAWLRHSPRTVQFCRCRCFRIWCWRNWIQEADPKTGQSL